MNQLQRSILTRFATGWTVKEHLYHIVQAGKDSQIETLDLKELLALVKSKHVEEAGRTNPTIFDCVIDYKLTDKGRRFACRELGIVVKEGLAWEE